MLAIGGLLAVPAAQAALVVGRRVFPVTLTFDDRGAGDELRLPQIIWQRDAGPQTPSQLQREFVRNRRCRTTAGRRCSGA